MRWKAIPRHQIGTTAGDYLRMIAAAAAAVRPGGRAETVRRFEAEFAEYVGCRHAISVASARLGLELILRGLHLEPGEVIVPAFNYFVVVERFIDYGLLPRFADVRRDNLNVDGDAVEALITPATRAILATHMFGAPCDLGRLAELARRHNLVLIEDCAHALGSTFDGRPVGTFGRAAIFSFSVMKMITTFGGGMVTIDDDELANAVRREKLALTPDPSPNGTREIGRGGIRDRLRRLAKGMVMDAGTRTLPFSLGAWPVLRLMRAFRPDFQRRIMTPTPAPAPQRGSQPTGDPGLYAFQAALGRAQLERVDQFIEKRRRVSAWLDEELTGIDGVAPLRSTSHAGFNGMYYGVLAGDAEALSAWLFNRGIDGETSEYRNCAALEMFREFPRCVNGLGGSAERRCSAAEDVERRILRLPNHPSLTRRDAARIGRVVRRFYESAIVSAAGPAARPGLV